MKLSRLSLADYNQLDSIPVLNQDLSAAGFTPVANTYYRHTGATTDTFTQGVIYLYDTAYHKLGESGGTTLNRYELTLTTRSGLGNGQVELVYRIMENAKSYVLYAGFANANEKRPVTINSCIGGGIPEANQIIITYSFESFGSYASIYIVGLNEVGSVYKTEILCNADGTTVTRSTSGAPPLYIVYYNDTEIT